MNNTPKCVSEYISNIYGNKDTGRYAAVVMVSAFKVWLLNNRQQILYNELFCKLLSIWIPQTAN